jgi:hypothetical protein
MNEVKAVFGQKVFDWNRTFDQDSRQDRSDLPPGSCCWIVNQDNEIACLTFVCPCGCGKTHAINVKKGEKVDQAWKWNGDCNEPSLEPSIRCLTPCGWHGHLIDGVFKQC